jgi:hypothetical protein
LKISEKFQKFLEILDFLKTPHIFSKFLKYSYAKYGILIKRKHELIIVIFVSFTQKKPKNIEENA